MPSLGIFPSSEHPEVALRAAVLANIRDRRIAAAKLQRDTLHKNLESIYDFEKEVAETQHRKKVKIPGFFVLLTLYYLVIL